MNSQNIIFFDFETTSKNPYTCQPTEFAAVCIDARKLEIREGSEFTSLIRPVFDEEKCQEYNLDVYSDEAAKKTGITKEMLETAPTIDIVWPQVIAYVKRYNTGGSKWTAPIRAGFNIVGYDNHIIKRICGGHRQHLKKHLNHLSTTKAFKDIKIPRIQEPYGFGPWDDERMEDTLFSPRDCLDLMNVVWLWTENRKELTSYSMDSIREWLGIPKEGAHRALKDVIDGAKVLIKFMNFTRDISAKTKFKGRMSE